MMWSACLCYILFCKLTEFQIQVISCLFQSPIILNVLKLVDEYSIEVQNVILMKFQRIKVQMNQNILFTMYFHVYSPITYKPAPIR